MTIKALDTNSMKKLIIVFVLPLFLMNCGGLTGEEIARLKINRVSTEGNFTAKEVSLDLKKGDEIAFWSDMDIAYEEDVTLQFKVKIFKNKTKISEFGIDPTKKNITIGEVKSNVMGKTKWSFSGKNHTVTIDEDATYRITSILVTSISPSLKVNKAELVLKK